MNERQEPKFFSVAEIGKIFGISNSKAYEIMATDNCSFNVAKIGKRICIPANSFYKWYESSASDGNTKREIKEE